MKGSNVAAMVFGGIVVLALGYLVGRFDDAESRVEEAMHAEHGEDEATLWTCPMHPQIQVPDPGACPLCGMALVPMQKQDDPGPKRLRISEADALLADIETAPVERRYVSKLVRLVGELDFDETRVRTIAARVPGRLERLFVDYTGIPVIEGDHLVRIYSPELFTAQQELLEAKRRVDSATPERSEFLAASDRRAYESAREKLTEWGLSDEWIDGVLERGTPEDRITIDSPISGIVVHKMVNEGDYVKTGTQLYKIADLDRLWVRIEVFEKDLPWVRYGQSVSLTTDALPGQVFEGRISFLDPVLDERTRTVRARAQVDNTEGLLKPGMFVRAMVDARLAQGGKVMDARLAGKWICPMHPEVVADEPGDCDVCGMDLVQASDLGYVAADTVSTKPLVIPYSAVLPTGRRAIVYVKVPGQAKPTFEGREIVLGPRAGDDQVVLAGLRENELVAVHGAFKIDSALQIHAKRSLLSMGPGGQVIHGAREAVFLASLEPLWSAYFVLGRALVASDAEAATIAFHAVGDALAEAKPEGLYARHAEVWDDERHAIAAAVATAAAAGPDLDALRAAFHDLSRAMIDTDVRFGHAGQRVHRETFCPMAFDNKGARWLQLGNEVRNPYFGDQMLTCGEFRRLLPGRGGEADPELEAGPPPEPERAETGKEREVASTVPRPVLDALTAVFDAAVGVQRALAADDQAAAREPLEGTAAAARAAVEELDAVPEGERETLRAGLSGVIEAVDTALAASDLKARRAAFEPLSNALLELIGRYGHSSDTPFAEAHCPMAFDDKGANWLQRGEEILNPYFGSEMLSCGWVEREFEPRAAEGGVPAFVAALTPVYEAYLDGQEALTADDEDDRAGPAFRRLADAVEAIDLDAAPAAARQKLEDLLKAVGEAAAKAGLARDLESRREAFEPLSVAVTALHDAFGHAMGAPLREAYCPMAFDNQGAGWLQRGAEVLNPYFGSEMLQCGEIRRTLPPRKD